MQESAAPLPIPPEHSSRMEAFRRHWAIRAATILLPVVIASVVTHWTARRDSKDEAQGVKNKGEVGFQEVAKKETQQDRFNAVVAQQMQELKGELAELRRSQLRPPPPRRKPARVAPPTPPPPVPTAKLSPNLDAALELARAPAAGVPPAPAAPAPSGPGPTFP